MKDTEGDRPQDPEFTEFFNNRVEPAVRNRLRPKIKDLERKLVASGVRHQTWEDLEQETLTRIWKSLQTHPEKIDEIEDVPAYAWRVAVRIAQGIRRGRGLQRARYRVEAVFRSREDRLARWRDKTSVIGGLREWTLQPEVEIFDFWQPVIEKFNRLDFWKGNKLRGDVIENAIFEIFGCTGRPVRLAQIALILASHWQTLDPVWASAAENPKPNEGVILFPPGTTDGEQDPAVRRGEIRFDLERIRSLPLKQRLVLLKDLDWTELSIRGYVRREILAELLGLENDEFLPWLYEWARTEPTKREKMFNVGKHPEKVLWKARRKLEKILRSVTPMAILFCLCHFLHCWVANL